MENIYQGLGHIAVNTEDIEMSIAFYEKIGGKLLTRDTIDKPEGTLYLALVALGSVVIELLQHPSPTLMAVGNIPHFAVMVENVDEAAALIRAAGVDSFKTPEKCVGNIFGGIENWFFTGPSGEEIELLHMYQQ